MTIPKASFGERTRAVPYEERRSAYAVVTSPEDRIAIVRESGGYYLPGGAIEAGETAVEAVVREAQEECGARLIVHSLLCQAEQFLFSPGEGHFRIDADIFLGELSADFKPGGNTVVWLQACEAYQVMSREFEAWAISIAAGSAR